MPNSEVDLKDIISYGYGGLCGGQLSIKVTSDSTQMEISLDEIGWYAEREIIIEQGENKSIYARINEYLN